MKNDRQATVFHANDGIWIQWLGHPVQYLADTDATNGTYCASIGSAPQGAGAPPHRHKFVEGFYILSGEVEFTAGNETVILTQGEFINVGSMTAHFPRVKSQHAELLTIAAPTGFDQFQMQAGEQLASRDSEPTKSADDVKKSIMQLAPQFDIDMNPPDEAFESTPKVHVARSNDGEIVDAVGDRYRFLVEGDQTNGLYAMWHATISAGGGPPLHTHSREEEAFYVLKGELTFEADGQQFTGGPGTFVNLPVGSTHRFSNQTDTNAEVLILVAPAGLEKMFRRTGTEVEDASTEISKPTPDEKKRLVEIAPAFGIELHLPSH